MPVANFCLENGVCLLRGSCRTQPNAPPRRLCQTAVSQIIAPRQGGDRPRGWFSRPKGTESNSTVSQAVGRPGNEVDPGLRFPLRSGDSRCVACQRVKSQVQVGGLRRTTCHSKVDVLELTLMRWPQVSRTFRSFMQVRSRLPIGRWGSQVIGVFLLGWDEWQEQVCALLKNGSTTFEQRESQIRYVLIFLRTRWAIFRHG
jgi:hypothetical protein